MPTINTITPMNDMEARELYRGIITASMLKWGRVHWARELAKVMGLQRRSIMNWLYRPSATKVFLFKVGVLRQDHPDLVMTFSPEETKMLIEAGKLNVGDLSGIRKRKAGVARCKPLLSAADTRKTLLKAAKNDYEIKMAQDPAVSIMRERMALEDKLAENSST